MARIKFSGTPKPRDSSERWRKVTAHVWASDFGRIWWAGLPWEHRRLPGIVRQVATRNGYMQVTIPRINGGRPIGVHRLVAHAFHGECPDGNCVDHIDSDPSNNRADNLQYVTPSENTRLYWKRRRKVHPVLWGLMRSSRTLRIATSDIARRMREREALVCGFDREGVA